MKDPAAIYTSQFYAVHAAGVEEYRRLADVVHDMFPDLHKVLDIGVGPVLRCTVSRSLATRSTASRGRFMRSTCHPSRTLSTSPTSRRSTRATSTRRILVVCTEMAEHLDPEHADHLVSLLAGLAQSAIYFTAATPGQGGQDHVNEQPREYWVSKFAALGWVLDEHRTSLMRSRLFEVIRHQIWYPLNSMVFVRPGSELPATEAAATAATPDISVAMVVPLCGWDPARIASRQLLKQQLGPPPAWVSPKVLASDQWVHVSRWFSKAIDMGIEQNATHFLLMQDDARVAPDFWNHLHRMLTAKPDDVIALYTVHPNAPQMQAAGLKWLAGDGCDPRCGVGMPDAHAARDASLGKSVDA